MKNFNEYKKSRLNAIYLEQVEANHKAYSLFIESILLEFGVTSPVELNETQYKEYLKKLEEYKTDNVVTTTENKQFNLSEAQLDLIKDIVNSIPLKDAALKLEAIFSSKLPEVYEGINLESDTIKLKFKNIVYDFKKVVESYLPKGFAVPLPEGEIKSEKEFTEYAEAVMKKAHGDKYDQKIVDKMVKDLIKKFGDDWGAMVGAMSSGLG